jgi:hypothetical protein
VPFGTGGEFAGGGSSGGSGGGGGGGTVTSVSVVSANGLAGTVATATTTPAITLSTSVTGVLKGNGTAISAGTAGTDYSAGTAALATGLVKSTTTTGALSIAVAGTDYLTPTGNGASLTGLTVGQVSGAAALASPTFTGTPAAPTAAVGTNTTQLATTAFVQSAVQQPTGQNTQTLNGSVAGTAIYKEIYTGADLKLYMIHFTGWNDVGTTITYTNAWTYTPGAQGNPDLPSNWNATGAVGKTTIQLPTTAGVAMTGYVVIGPGL